MGVNHRNQKIEGAVRIAHNQKQRRFPVSQLIQLQFIVHRGIPNFLNIKGRKACTAGNKDRFHRFAGSQLEKTVLPHGKGVRFPLTEFFKQQIHWILILFIVLSDFHGIEQLQQRCKVLFFRRCLIVKIRNQRSIEQFFAFSPERVASGSLPFCIGHQGRNQFQNVLFFVDISERIIMHRLVEIDGVHRLNEVPLLCKGMSALVNETSFRVRNHE